METVSFLAKEAPGFAVKGENVVVLTEPTEYHKELCARASNVRRRAIFASLYLGTGYKEQALVDSVERSLEKFNGNLKVRFLLDYSRGTRDVKGQSSCSKLLPLVEKYKVSNLSHNKIMRLIYEKSIEDDYFISRFFDFRSRVKYHYITPPSCVAF